MNPARFFYTRLSPLSPSLLSTAATPNYQRPIVAGKIEFSVDRDFATNPEQRCALSIFPRVNGKTLNRCFDKFSGLRCTRGKTSPSLVVVVVVFWHAAERCGFSNRVTVVFSVIGRNTRPLRLPPISSSSSSCFSFFPHFVARLRSRETRTRVNFPVSHRRANETKENTSKQAVDRSNARSARAFGSGDAAFAMFDSDSRSIRPCMHTCVYRPVSITFKTGLLRLRYLRIEPRV